MRQKFFFSLSNRIIVLFVNSQAEPRQKEDTSETCDYQVDDDETIRNLKFILAKPTASFICYVSIFKAIF